MEKFHPIHSQIFYTPLAFLDFEVFLFFRKILSYTCVSILSPTCLSKFLGSLFVWKILSHTCANILSPTCLSRFLGSLFFLKILSYTCANSLSPTGCSLNIVFFHKMIFLNSASSAAAGLVFDLPLCTLTDTEGKPKKIFGKTQYLMNTL